MIMKGLSPQKITAVNAIDSFLDTRWNLEYNLYCIDISRYGFFARIVKSIIFEISDLCTYFAVREVTV